MAFSWGGTPDATVAVAGDTETEIVVPVGVVLELLPPPHPEMKIVKSSASDAQT